MTSIGADDLLTGTIEGTIAGNDWSTQEAALVWNSDQDTIRTNGEVYHGTGRRRIDNEYKLSELLDSMAATRAGRKAMLKAIAKAVT